MSGKLNLKKSNILKRLSIPSISEIKYKESLLNALKEKEPEPATNKKIINIKSAMRKSIDHYDNQAKEKKKKIDYHDLEIKLEELENAQKIKDEEILKINNKLEDEKNKVKNLLDIIAKKELTIDSLKKNLDIYEKQNEGNNSKNNEFTPNKLIKIDIINKKVEYNLNSENIHLKEELKLINEENLKLMEELEKNKEIIINLNKDLEKYKNETIAPLKGFKNENNAQKNNLNRKEEKSIDINEEQINLRNEQMNNLKEINEKYKKEIKEKENLIDQLYEKINFYIKEKEDAEQKIIHINAIHERLQNELGDIKKSIKEKEDYNNNLINYLKEEAIEA